MILCPRQGVPFDPQTAAGRVAGYQLGEGRTVLLLHSFNAAGGVRAPCNSCRDERVEPSGA